MFSAYLCVLLRVNEDSEVYVMVMQLPVPINNQVPFDVAAVSEVASLFASVAACKSTCCVTSLTARRSKFVHLVGNLKNLPTKAVLFF